MLKSLRAFFLLMVLIACQEILMEEESQSCQVMETFNPDHPLATVLESKMVQIVQSGIPGVSVAVYNQEHGYWTGSAGLAKLETSLPMQPCHLQFGQSVAKTYMATAILILYEQGKLNLDDPISRYLSEEILKKLPASDNITIRMLLNHRSGMPEYNTQPEYITFLLQHPLHQFKPLDYLDFIEGKSLQFDPGSKYIYTNTNYLLLAFIADEITGDHTEFIRQNILTQQGLNHTFYHESGFLEHPSLVNTYWDRYSNGQIENCSAMQKVNVASLIGDDGIIATPIDYVKFLRALLNTEIIGEAALNEMLDFQPKETDEPDGYGLGLHRDFYNGQAEIGHSGGGIGAGCLLGYFPASDTYYFLGMNMGSIVYSPNFEGVEKIIDEIYDILLQ